MRSALGVGYTPKKTRKLRADAIPTEYLELVVNKGNTSHVPHFSHVPKCTNLCT